MDTNDKVTANTLVITTLQAEGIVVMVFFLPLVVRNCCVQLYRQDIELSMSHPLDCWVLYFFFLLHNLCRIDQYSVGYVWEGNGID